MTNYARYQILSTYDIAQIAEKLGEVYNNMGAVNRAANEAYAALSVTEQNADLRQTLKELNRLKKETV